MENPENHIYLHEYAHLLPLLLQSGRLINTKGELVKEVAGLAQLHLTIEEVSEKQWSGILSLSLGEAKDRDFL